VNKTYLFALAAVLAACGDGAPDPLPPSDVQHQIDTHLNDVLANASGSLAAAAAATPHADSFALLERVLGLDTPAAQAVAQLAAAWAPPLPALDVPTIVTTLRTQVFTDAHYRGDGIYDVAPATLCALIHASDPTGCAALLTKLGVQLHTTAIAAEYEDNQPTDGGLTFSVQIGPQHIEPLAFDLTTLREGDGAGPTGVTLIVTLAMRLDLDLAQKALSTLPAGSVPSTSLAGQIHAQMSSPGGPIIYAIVDRPLVITLAGASDDLAGTDAFSLRSDAGGFTLRLFDQSPTQDPVGSLELDCGTTTIVLPADGDGARRGIALPETILTASTASAATDLDLSLRASGPITLSRNGQATRTFTLAPVEITVRRGAVDTLTAMPPLALAMTADHAALGDVAPPFDVTQISLDGTVTTTAAPDRLALTTGAYRLDTAPTGHGFFVDPNQCITGDETTATPPFVQWSVGACE
jgi:hypothetical protein